MTTNEVIGNLENKAFHGSAASLHEKLTADSRLLSRLSGPIIS